MDVSDRLKAVCKNKKIKNIDLVELGCGSQQTVSFVLNGKNKPNSQFLEIFLNAHKDVNARWLNIYFRNKRPAVSKAVKNGWPDL